MHPSRIMHFHIIFSLFSSLIIYCNSHAIFTHFFSFFTFYLTLCTHLYLYIYIFIHLHTNTYIFIHLHTNTFSQIAHMHFSTPCTLTLLFESSFASFMIFYEVFPYWPSQFMWMGSKASSETFLDLRLHFSSISHIQFAYIPWVEKLGK